MLLYGRILRHTGCAIDRDGATAACPVKQNLLVQPRLDRLPSCRKAVQAEIELLPSVRPAVRLYIEQLAIRPKEHDL